MNSPVIVKSADGPDERSAEAVAVDIVANSARRATLSVPVDERVLGALSTNTAELQEKLNKFVNGVSAKIQTVDMAYFWKLKRR